MRNKKKVLVFDDDEDLLSIFRFLFEDNGWEVLTFQNCDNILEIAAEHAPQLILMDNWIPSIGGIAATQLLKKDSLLKNIPVVYISANNDVGTLSIKAGADAFMAKPFDFVALEQLANKLTQNNNSQ
jgi:CheY-like chemotaxis protein